MVSHRWSGRWRVYWNSKREYPKVWSIDRGTVESEIKLEAVTIQCACRAQVDMMADNTVSPQGWIEGIGEVRIYDDKAALLMGPGLVVHTQSFDKLTGEN